VADESATAIRFAPQYSVPLRFLVDQFSYVRFVLGPEYAVTERIRPSADRDRTMRGTLAWAPLHFRPSLFL
jgi:hypothetical protein